MTELNKPSAIPISSRSDRSLLEEILERTRAAGLLEREFKGRLLTGLGYIIGEMSYQDSGAFDRNKLTEAVLHCQQGYNYLKEVGGAPEFLGLNNLVFYSMLLNEPTKREIVLIQARSLWEVGHEHNATNLILTACGALLKLSSDEDEKRDARRWLRALPLDSLSEKERKEVKTYLGQEFEDEAGLGVT